MNKEKKEIKSFLKKMRLNRTYRISLNNRDYAIEKKASNKYLVSCIDDILFFNLYDNVIMTKHNLINIIVNGLER